MKFKFPKCKKEFSVFWKKICNMVPRQHKEKINGSIVLSGDIGQQNMFLYSRGRIKKAKNITEIREKNFIFFGKNENEFNVTVSLFNDEYNRYPGIVKKLQIEQIETKLGVFGFQPILKNLPKFPKKLKNGETINLGLEFQCKGIVPNNTLSLEIKTLGYEPTIIRILKQCDIPPKSKKKKIQKFQNLFSGF